MTKKFCTETDLQTNTIPMNVVSDPLDLRVKRPLRTVQASEWSAWTSEAKVIADTLKHSGLQDKTVAIEAGIDPAVLSKAQSGAARLNEAQMDALMDACGSEAWLYYWVLKRGYDPRKLTRLESDLERENRELREQVAQMQHEREIELRLIRDMRVAA